MESVDLDMGEIFDDNDPDEDIGATGILPDLPEATQAQEENEEENAAVLARLKDLSKGAAKKVVRRPQPKLDPTRLTGDRGIPILPKLFEDTKFKGKGYERENLAIIMRKMEHWAHRLFPKMPFDEVVERVEKLGSKKEVQTCVKKIRLDMPVLDNDFIGSDQEDDDDDETVPKDDVENSEIQGNVRAEDMWDELLCEEEEINGSQLKSTSTVAGPKPGPSTSPSNNDNLPVTPAPKTVTSPAGFTPDQLERIERNKQIAMEKRLKKMGHLTPANKQSARMLPGSQTPGSSQAQHESQSENTTTKNTEVEREPGADSPDPNETNKTQTPDSAGTTSQVWDRGTSNNVTVVDKFAKNAQNWCTASSGHTEKQNIEDGVGDLDTVGDIKRSAEDTENLTSDTEKNSQNIVNGNNTKPVSTDNKVKKLTKTNEENEVCETINGDLNMETDEMSEVIENQDLKVKQQKGLHSSANNESEMCSSDEMSEVIEKQDTINVVLKEKQNNATVVKNTKKDSCNMKKTEDICEVPAELENIDTANESSQNKRHGKENVVVGDREKGVALQDQASGGSQKLIVNGNLAITKDNMDFNDIDFDEEIDPDQLTEEQLMDTLDS